VQIRKEYELMLYRLNNWSDFRDINGIFTGRILGIGDYGSLKIETVDSMIREYSFKEVEFIL
jgi:hypothetical protein